MDEKREPSDFERQDYVWLVLTSIAFFALVIVAAYRAVDTQWAPIQRRFREVLEEHGQIQAARRFQIGIKQIWNPDIGVVDRCVTCHLGYEWGSVLRANLPQPLAPHPSLPYMDKHPFEKFGCTVCHGGQGWATTAEMAHVGGKHWDDPMLSRKLAAQYGLTEAELMQMRCNFCHRHDLSTPGADAINEAKVLFKKKKCLVCHVLEGRGGLVGPELTYFGDKNPELFDYSRITGPHTVFNWSFQHFMNPDKVSPKTTMPIFGFQPAQARALTLLVLSWKRINFPPQYIPTPVEVTPPYKLVTVPAAPPVVAGADKGRAIFRTHGCVYCHTVGGGRLLGPDLKGVGTERDENWLRGWLADPAAVIRSHPELAQWPQQYDGIVMPNQNLSPDEINALVTYLHGL
jgi:cytochrome c2